MFSFTTIVERYFSARRRRPHGPARRPVKHRGLRIEGLEQRALLSITLGTDKLDYAPGETAYITAAELAVGETVEFQITSDTPGPGQDPWQVTDGGADDLDQALNGAILTSWLVDPDGAYLGSTLVASATALGSGDSATITFTDGVHRPSVEITSGVVTVTSLSSLVTVTFNYATHAAGMTTGTVFLDNVTLWEGCLDTSPTLAQVMTASITVTLPQNTPNGEYDVSVKVQNTYTPNRGDEWAAAATAKLDNGIVVNVQNEDPIETTVTITADGGTYNGSAFEAAGSVVGDNGETVTEPPLVFTYYAGTYSTKEGLEGLVALSGAPINAGNYTVLAEYAGNDTYAPSYAIANFTIHKAALTVSAENVTKTYGQAILVTGSVDGIQNYDDITATFTSAGAAATAGVAGSPYAITATLTDPAGKLENYAVTYDLGTVTVQKAALTVSAENVTKTYGQAIVVTGSVDGIQNYDDITATFTSAGAAATAGVAGSPYAIIATLADPAGKLENYAVTYNLGTVTVEKAILDADAHVQAALDLAKNGTVMFNLSNVTGIVDGKSVSDLLNGAIFTLKMKNGECNPIYETKQFLAAATVDAYGVVHLKITMAQASLSDGDEMTTEANTFDAFLLQGLDSGETSASRASLESITLSATSHGGNYDISEDVWTKIFSTIKK